MTSDPTWDAQAFPAAIASNFTIGAHVAGYRLEQIIGRGGMAMVFRAVDERLGRQVALKILAPALAEDTAFRQRFVGESRMAASVDDPHIIPVHEAGEAAGVLFIAMRYVPGGDVRTLLHQAGPMSGTRVAAITSPVASALDAAHSVGLIHRDVKPANMLLDSRAGRPDHIYLSDFGLGKQSISPSGLTQTGQILGTPAYSSPEQVEGKPLDGRADQYSLACSVFEMLTGAPPFVQTQITALILAQMSSPPPSLTSRRPDLPVAADPVFAKALAKKRDDRYATCREFAEDLRQAFGLVPYDSGPDIIVPPVHAATEVASDGGASTHDLPAGETPTNINLKVVRPGGGSPAVRPGGGSPGAAEQTTPRPWAASPPQQVTPAAQAQVTPASTPPGTRSEIPPGSPPWAPPGTPPGTTATAAAGTAAESANRRPAVIAAACLFLLGALAAIGSIVYPGNVTAGAAVIMVAYVIAAVLAVWLLVGRQMAVVGAILLGLWAPAVGFVAADVVAVAADHSFDLTGSALANYYVGDLSDVLGVVGLLVLWSAWKPNRTAGPPRSRGGMPVALVLGAALIGVAEVVIYVSFGRESFNNFSAYDYAFGVGGLVVGVAAALVAISVRNSGLGGAILLGWAVTMAVLPFDLLTSFSVYSALVKVAIVLMLLLLAAFVVLTIAYISRRSRQAAGVAGQGVATGGR
jgi:serine/threonine protein kinase